MFSRSKFYEKVGMKSLFASIHDALLFAIYNAHLPDYLNPTTLKLDDDILVRFTGPTQLPSYYVCCEFSVS